MCVLLLQDLLQSCARGGRRRVEDMCYERRRAEACVDESAHHAHVCLLLQYLFKDLGGGCLLACAQSRGPTKSTVATFPRTRECRAREVLLRWQRGPRGPRATGEPAGCALYTCSVRVSCLDPVRVLRALAPPARCRRPQCAQAWPRAATLRHPAEPWCQLGRSPSYGE